MWDNYNVVYLTYACKLMLVELYTDQNTQSAYNFGILSESHVFVYVKCTSDMAAYLPSSFSDVAVVCIPCIGENKHGPFLL